MISSNSKLDLKLDSMVIRGESVRRIHLSEISVLILENTAISMTAMLLCELSRRKIKVIFCDDTHNPYGELCSYYGSHDAAGKLKSQIMWREDTKGKVWARIVSEKISNQARILDIVDPDRSKMLFEYSKDVHEYDETNREGHAAKVYFNTIFGEGYTRHQGCDENTLLNYGYAVLLSAVNREITSLGYDTRIGIFHANQFNHFNFGCDLMEPLRPLVDRAVIGYGGFDIGSKRDMANILNEVVLIDGKKNYLTNALKIYVKSVTDALSADDCDIIQFCEYENQSYEADCVF